MSRAPKWRPPRRIIFDYGRVDDIPKTKALNKEFLKFHWEFYSEVAYQRAQIYDALKSSLREKAGPFRFEKWQRAVKYRYSLKPLGTAGSKADPGGRFNVGAIDPSRFTVFPALYLASEKETALDELFARNNKGELLTFEELALSRAASVTVVSLSGALESVLDLRVPSNLSGFVELIKGFKLPSSFISRAKALSINPPWLIRTVVQLMEALTGPTWRFMPMQCDVPAPSQIFGQIVMAAGIEGIVYPSVLSKEPCLVVYPQNFGNSSAFIEIDDPVPAETVKKRIDASSFKSFI